MARERMQLAINPVQKGGRVNIQKERPGPVPISGPMYNRHGGTLRQKCTNVERLLLEAEFGVLLSTYVTPTRIISELVRMV